MEYFSIIIGVLVLLLIILITGYVKASPDRAFIISGLRKKPKILIGKAGIKIPFFEKKDELSLQLIQVDVKTASAVPTADYININVDATVNVKISDQEERLKLAAQNFLNKKTDYIGGVAKEVLEGNVREIVGKMTLEDMVSDRQKFADLVRQNAAPDLAAMGLDIISFNVQNFTDGQGVIENLGVDNVVKISKNAAVSRANAEKEIAVAQAQAAKESNDAKVLAETEIAQRNNELEIKKAELQKEADIKKAEADAAYRIQEEEQRKTIEITTANANIAKQEREIELRRKEAEVKEQALDAEIKKTAEAEKYAIQQKADADLYATQKEAEAALFERQKKAEAERFEKEKIAEAEKIAAEAAKFAKQQEAEAQKALADAIRAKGIAEADAVRARGEAEAASIKAKLEAEAEGLNKKADAMNKYGEAAKQDMQLQTLKVLFEQMPGIAEGLAKAWSSVDKVEMYGDSGNQFAGNLIGTLKQFTTGVAEGVGVNIPDVLNGALSKATKKQEDETKTDFREDDTKDNK